MGRDGALNGVAGEVQLLLSILTPTIHDKRHLIKQAFQALWLIPPPSLFHPTIGKALS